MASNPLDWYWRADDGRIYSSSRNALVYSYDTAYLAHVAKHGGVTPWPVDINGRQTSAALQETLAISGINVTVPGA